MQARLSRPSPQPLPPDQAWPQLFAAVQEARLFADQKHFADAVPRRDPASIEGAYLAARNSAGFDLRRFVLDNFALPAEPEPMPVEHHAGLRAHIDALWPRLVRHSPRPDAHDSLLPLPCPYVVPGGRFRELYYWDSYFTMLGLVESGQNTLSRQMLGDFAHLIDAWGHVPNGNRSYYLSRSQPPLFSHMVELEARDDPQVAVAYLPQLRREHAFWMEGGAGLAPGQAMRRVVRMTDGSLLNRYWDDRDAPRPESFVQDRLTAAAAARPAAGVYRDLRAGAESGWDFSSRWLDDPMRLDTIRTTDIVPVDLNSLLHHLEATIAAACTRSGDRACAREYRAMADARAGAIQRYLWQPQGWYADYDWRRGVVRPALTAAALFPLYAGIATPGRAHRTATAVRAQLLRPGGLVTTTVDSGQQWDAPNAWAPLQWVAVAGLRRYGEEALAHEVAATFTGNVQALFAREHKLVEKYDADGALQGGGGGEYPLQDGFGWTNGVVLKLFAVYPDLEHVSTRPEAAESGSTGADAGGTGAGVSILPALGRRSHVPALAPGPP
ncbi:MAG: alpha,alpha-trehalase TreA [Pseudoxanthomonas sp.]|nr:alpha,alpha-trehalase TreA [Pseudoxanthomonas sp.]